MKKQIVFLATMIFSVNMVMVGCKVQAHNHTYSEEWTSDVSGHWKEATCEHTGEISGFSEHTYGIWNLVEEPTINKEGRNERTCSVCGYIVESLVLQAAPEGFVFVKGGTVTGAKNENNSSGVFIEGRTVNINDFYMGKYEVTQEEYASVMANQKVTLDGCEYILESNPSYCTGNSTIFTLFSGDEQGKRPVEGVSWYDAVWYCNALSEKEGLTKAYNIEVTRVFKDLEKTGYFIDKAKVSLVENAKGYRLPTEAEWEYAARGGDLAADDWNCVFSGADTAEGVSYSASKNSALDSVGWYRYNIINGITGDIVPSRGSQGYGSHQVGKKAANRLGLYDMSGNVFEWCYDWYGVIHADTPADGALSGFFCVNRGGSWNSFANYASVTFRFSNSRGSPSSNLGFRVVRSAN